MLNKLKRLINQNRLKIFLVVFVFVGIILLIQIFNSQAKNKINEKNEQNSSSANTTTIYSNTYQNESGVISNSNIGSNTNTQNNQLITQFMTFCNAGQLEQAYNLLSKDCKQYLFPDVKSFKTIYYDKVFNKKRELKTELWNNQKGSYTYRVTIVNDVLAEGGYDSASIEDYYTIVTENGEKKLNINNFIGKTVIDKQIDTENASLKVNYKLVYTDYEIYNLALRNNTNKTILLDSQEETNTVYLVDEDKHQYSGDLTQVLINNLILEPEQVKGLEITFNKMYSNRKKIEQLVFSDIIKDKEAYEKTIHKTEYKNRISLAIKF